jgi:hypothetical protein
MSATLAIDVSKIYRPERIAEFEAGCDEMLAAIQEVLMEEKLQELAAQGFIRLATKGLVHWDTPPRYAGKPLSEYVREIRE